MAGVGARERKFHFILTPLKKMRKYLKPMQEVR
jgi:hypothetical protein